jgi:hypothetical protein
MRLLLLLLACSSSSSPVTCGDMGCPSGQICCFHVLPYFVDGGAPTTRRIPLCAAPLSDGTCPTFP